MFPELFTAHVASLTEMHTQEQLAASHLTFMFPELISEHVASLSGVHLQEQFVASHL
jgi:hypothetical protein